MGGHLLYLVITYICTVIIYAHPTDVSMVNSEQKLNQSPKICDGELNLSINMFRTAVITKGFICSSSIKQLSLTKSNIQSIEEDAFINLPFLERLDLSDNNLAVENLFSFGEIPSLKRLILDGNFYDSTLNEPHYRSPYCTQNYYWSDRLQACVRKYTKLEVPYNYPEVNSLSVRNIHIDSISEDWKTRFPKLEYLDLSENYFKWNINLFDNIPPTVETLIIGSSNLIIVNAERLSNVVDLQLNNNNFKTLSIDHCDNENTLCLKNFPALKSLHISNCDIEEIEPSAFSELQNLTHLNISYNIFEEIPDDIFNGTSLMDLDLSGNYLSTVNFISLKGLYALHMNDMKNISFSSLFEDISDSLPNLHTLTLSNNELRNIPSSVLSKLPNLQYLDLSFNLIKALPSWEWQPKLEYLSLTCNKILNIEDLSLNNVTSLKVLELKQNLISDFKISDIKYFPENLIVRLTT